MKKILNTVDKDFFGGGLLMLPSEGGDCKRVPGQVVIRSELLAAITSLSNG